jgi:hypothetical protein
MSKEVAFTVRLERGLRDAFMAEAEAIHRPASQVMRALMCGFIERQRQARVYDAFLRITVDTARRSLPARSPVALTSEGFVILLAEQDHADVVGHITQDYPPAAIRLDELFETAVGRLAEHSMMGGPG